jgi:hypothetical protein
MCKATAAPEEEAYNPDGRSHVQGNRRRPAKEEAYNDPHGLAGGVTAERGRLVLCCSPVCSSLKLPSPFTLYILRSL